MSAPSPGAYDRQVLAPVLRRHLPLAPSIVCGIWVVLVAVELGAGRYGLAGVHAALALLGVVVLWRSSGTWLRRISPDALTVQRGRRRRTIARAELTGVEARHLGGGYGIVVHLLDGDPVEVPATARRFTVAAAQARELRRWAGLPD